ncbi:MAG: ComF family protein [Candidatus Omnitrophica bacterium]|jgi:ComF family protein|nr:ComF family protein [Candidatus Omnitrophota bacterium]
MTHTFLDISKAVLNLIFPVYCQGCGEPLGYDNDLFLCRKCLEKLTPFSDGYCPADNVYPFLEKTCHCCIYDGLVRELIHKFKYEKKLFLKRAFVQLLHGLFAAKMADKGIETIISVPMLGPDERVRGFNQSEILAKGLSKKTDIAYKNALKKNFATNAQAGLRRAQRLTNVKDAFSCRKQIDIRDKRVMIIDDVFTTGSTINECAKALKTGGSGAVFAMTLARGI